MEENKNNMLSGVNTFRKKKEVKLRENGTAVSALLRLISMA